MPLNRQRLLRYAEYAAVSASVAGAIVAVATRQVIYGVAPLSAAVALNLASRRYWEHQIEQRLVQTTTQVGQHFDRLSQRNKLIEQRLRALPQQPANDLPEGSDQQDLREESSRLIQALTDDIQGLRQSVAQQATRSSLEAVSAELHQLQQSLAALEAFNLENRLQALEQLPPEQQPVVDGWSLPIAQLNTDLSQLRADFTQLRRDVARLEVLFRDSPPAPQETVEPPAGDQPSSVFQWVPPQLPSAQDFTLEINLGIDFGTGFTKVCFRDLASDRSEIVTFTETDEADLEQALLCTKVAILKDGTLLTGLTAAEWAESKQPIQKTIEFIKMRLAHLDLPEEAEWRLDQVPELDDPETVENICAYFLSTVITRAQEWIQQNRADLFVNQTTRWSLNTGVPVEYCDSPALARFQRVLSLAWLLANTPSSQQLLTINSLNQLGSHLRQWMQHSHDEPLDCFTTPEISAAVWSFLNSGQAEEKFYIVFDIGDGTADGVSFRHWREDGEPQIDFYSGYVQPLGVTAFSQQVAKELNTSTKTIKHIIWGWQLDAHSDHDNQNTVKNSNVRKRLQKLVGEVVMQGTQKHKAHRPIVNKDDLGSQLEVFMGGGGSHSPFFYETIGSTHKDFRQDMAGIPSYQVRPIPVPKNTLMNGINSKEFHRFSVAHGLCMPELHIPEKEQIEIIRLPSQIDMQEREIPTWKSNMPRYEDTRDLM
jgi:HPt (histidine-containing phosphotransfer) domain-containing protein